MAHEQLSLFDRPSLNICKKQKLARAYFTARDARKTMRRLEGEI
jgi:hypothetical protein